MAVGYSPRHRKPKEDPAISYIRRRIKKYGISFDDYQRMLIEQNGVCKICRKPEKKGKSLSVDHNHKTGKVRGLLCSRHNTGLGCFEDDAALLRSAADYLEKNSG
jgi:hypothetical protein